MIVNLNALNRCALDVINDEERITLAEPTYEVVNKKEKTSMEIAQNKSMSEKIKDIILAMDKPFNKIDLSYVLSYHHGIENYNLICDVLDDLCESGLVRFVQIARNCWAFVVVENTCS